LHLVLSGEGVVVASAAAASCPTPLPRAYRENCFELALGQEVSPKRLVDQLIDLDYDNEVQVRIPGEFSWRGGIVDCFSPAHDTPVRIDFFGDDIDEIRTFSPDSQRSDGHLKKCRIVPRGDRHGDLDGYLGDWLAEGAALLVWEESECEDHMSRFGGEVGRDNWFAFRRPFAGRAVNLAERMGAEASPVVAFGLEHLSGRLLPVGDEDSEPLERFRNVVERWQNDDYLVAFASSNARRRERVAGVPLPKPLAIVEHGLAAGVIFPRAKLVLLSERELFGRATPEARRNAHQYKTDFLLHSGTELSAGDLAVHAGYGICRFIGLMEQQFEGRKQEVMILEFADEGRIYVSLDRAYLVSRYVGAGKKLPRLSRIDGGRWKRAKEQAEQSAHDLAAELLRIQAAREATGAGNCGLQPEEADLYHAFEAAFPFRETPDQLAAIEAVREDLGGRKPMDRLLCGDVGFGKTEVAMRAACQVALTGRQVAVLAPTTVLVQQHFLNFKERFADFPVTVAGLSRFQSKAEQRDVLRQLHKGGIDVVIGTHRLLSFDVHFHDLGLVIIDEEQRFGVRHKERLKKLRANVNVLTMTATPIPRTLHFAMSGLRSLSTIMTPPESRLPVITTVCEEDDELVKHAIERELQRDGQVYYLHNRVNTIHKAAQRLQKLVPEAKMDVAHGQMHEDELEEAMLRFIGGETQVLVCTTIVESGMDIPNANTIIIDRADRFGLSQLYQLRGRVGRDVHQAYALMLIRKRMVLEDTARERLAAIRKYTHLGAGFKLAIRDLELRGSGNLLGSEQSGHIEAVGLDMYCKLLRAAVDQLKQRQPAYRPEVPVMLDFLTMGQPNDPEQPAAFLPESYLGELDLRVECARRMASVTEPKEVVALYDEMEDRFGKPPIEVQHLLKVHQVRAAASKRRIQSVSVRGDRVLLQGEKGLRRTAAGKVPYLQPGGTPMERLEQLVQCIGSLP
jgi:transcription-repair coupling factor (superfamily II helicase)